MYRPLYLRTGRSRRLGWWWRRRRSGCRRTMRSGCQGSSGFISERTFSAFRLVMKTMAFRLSTYDEIRMRSIAPLISERTFSAFRLVMKTKAFRMSTYHEIRTPRIARSIYERTFSALRSGFEETFSKAYFFKAWKWWILFWVYNCVEPYQLIQILEYFWRFFSGLVIVKLGPR